MADSNPYVGLPGGLVRGLGWDVDANVKYWDQIVRTTPTAPHFFSGQALQKSPDIRRFYHASFLSQRHRGYCVGFNTCGTIMTRLRIPLGATATTGDPLPLIQLSPLYTYDVARWQCTDDGYNMGSGDGLIASEAFKGAKKRGCVELSDYSSGPSDIDNHRNGTTPSQTVLTDGAKHLMKEFAIADSFEHGLELMSAGFPLAIASMIPNSMIQTDEKGFFRMRGSVVGGHCVPPDALIGGLVPHYADEVQIGDWVTGHDGKDHEVTEVHIRDYDGDMVMIWSTGNFPIRFTDEHPLLVYRPLRTWGIVIKPEMDLQKYGGDTRYARLAPQVITWNEKQPVWVSASDVEPGDFLLCPKRTLSTEVRIPTWAAVGTNGIDPKPITAPDSELAWFFGLYIADGNREIEEIRDKGIALTLSDDSHVERAAQVIKSLGLNACIDYEGEYTRVKCFSVSLCRSFQEWFGTESSQKHIPEFLFYGWDLVAVLDGVQDGDGATSGGYHVISTTSPVLLRQAWWILIDSGLRPRIVLQTEDSPGRYDNAKPLWHLRWKQGEHRHLHTRFFGNYYAMPVRDVVRVSYRGKVYNYEVADVHSYVADGAICHNCYQMLDYDKDENLAWIAQAWERWGEKTSDPHFADMHGFTQLGTCPLDELADWFTARQMSTGESEMLVCNTVDGFDSPIVDYGSM